MSEGGYSVGTAHFINFVIDCLRSRRFLSFIRYGLAICAAETCLLHGNCYWCFSYTYAGIGNPSWEVVV